MKVLNPFVLALTIAVGGALCASGGPAPNYWCTWATQGATLGRNVKAGKVAFAGDQGVPLQRDNLNEEVLFGEGGWAKRFYPNERGDLYLLLDAGWDLPYGTQTHGADLALRGACIPDAARFPSLKGTPAERLKALDAKAKACGWRGIGVWLPSHTQGEEPGKDGHPGRRLSLEEMRRVWTEKLLLCREAGVGYWKVDWGLRSWDCVLRGLMTELKNEIHPALTIEHCWVPGVPLNGIRISQNGKVEGPGRLFGYDVWAGKRADQAKTLAVSDVFRTYDVIAPFEKVTTLERCAYYSKLAEERLLPVLLNVEDEPLIGAGLGHVLGIMSSGAAGAGIATNDACVALAWQKLAPPFGHDTAAVTRYADETLEDVWTYADNDCSWFTSAARKTIRQSAPAVVTRGLALPTVRADGPKPFVCGARYPNGALALSFLTRTTGGRRAVACPADVTLDAKLEPGKPFGLFGAFKSVTLKGGASKDVRIRARQLPYGKPRDVTALCRIEDCGALVISGEVVEKPCGAYTPHVVLEAVSACVDSAAFVKKALANVEPASAGPQCERTAHGVRLVRGGRTVWEFSSAGGKPCVHPLALPDGTVVTASEDTDHPWHRGLWFAWKYLNGVNYWETDACGRSAGEQRIVSEDVSCEGAAATVRMAVAWGPCAEPERVLLDERREIAFSAPDAAGGYVITWAAKFTARERTTIERTPPSRSQKTGFWRGGYAGFSLRLGVFARNCRLISSCGAVEQTDVVAREKEWIDYVDPHTGAGIRLEILKAPGRRVFYHWQDHRFTNLSPVFDGSIVLERGETLELAYRATVHPQVSSD